MKNLTANEASCVGGGLNSRDYIEISSIYGACGGMLVGVLGQTYIIGMHAIKQQPPYTIGSAIGTAIGGIIWTLPILGVSIAGGATVGAMIGAIAGFTVKTD